MNFCCFPKEPATFLKRHHFWGFDKTKKLSNLNPSLVSLSEDKQTESMLASLFCSGFVYSLYRKLLPFKLLKLSMQASGIFSIFSKLLQTRKILKTRHIISISFSTQIMIFLGCCLRVYTSIYDAADGLMILNSSLSSLGSLTIILSLARNRFSRKNKFL